jgi:glyoxylase-like metal-dependent hydrolase (beta-lactamase superfamily II)
MSQIIDTRAESEVSMIDEQVYTIGEARVARVQEYLLNSFSPARLLPDWRSDHRDRLNGMPETTTPDGKHLLLSVHSWVVWINGKIIIVDTGVGNAKARPFAPYFDHLDTPYLARLERIGVLPEEVDYVLHTHLHVDHVGWNTTLVDGRWMPTFPNARHIFSAREYAWFTDSANLSDRNRTSFQVQADSVTPIVEAGLADMIDVTGDEVIPGFSFHPTPGHSVDHASIVLESAGARALFPGDLLHHPIEVLAPDLSTIFDPEREQTLRSRRWALEFAADREAITFSSHFPVTSAGRIARSGSGYEWRFV